MNQAQERSKVIKVSVTKESPDERVGLILMTDDSCHAGSIVTIKSISPNSLFEGTKLQPGMLIKSVNGVPVCGGEGMGLADTMRLLRQLEDVVTIEAVREEDVNLSRPAPLPGPEPMMVPLSEDEYDKYSVPEIMAVPLPMPVEPEGGFAMSSTNPSFRPVSSPTRDVPPPSAASGDFPFNPLFSAGSIPRVEDSFPYTGINRMNNTAPKAPPSAAMRPDKPQVYPLATDMSILRPQDSFDIDAPPKQNHAVSITVLKSTMDSSVGIKLAQKRNVGVVVSDITPGSLCQYTKLQVGMQILAINDVDCSHCEMSTHVVAALLRSCVGRVTIQAIWPDLMPQPTSSVGAKRMQVVTVTIFKPTKDSHVGLGICDRTCFNDNGGRTIPVIRNIASDGLAANTALRKDMRVLCLNGVTCRGRDDAIAMIQTAQGSLTVLAGNTDMVAATVTKSSYSHNMGLDLEQDVNGKVRIQHLPSWGLFASTDLRTGMQILVVNGVEVDELLLEDVQSIMDQVEGTVTVIACS